ncbi:sensor histidine kinase [Lysobacter korlensis]|uniref:histidine kinase n=1 Tax=Lysobacter korlensis TaxID=553636 RepID=A0ABV6RNF6_9GAMM
MRQAVSQPRSPEAELPALTGRARTLDVVLIAIALLYVLANSFGFGEFARLPQWYWGVDIALGVVASVALWWARKHPVLIGVLMIIPGTLSITAGLAVVAAVYRLGASASPRLSIPVVGVHLALALPYHWVVDVPGMDWLTWLIFIPLLYLLTLSVGLLARARQQVIEGLQRAAVADRERYNAQLATLRRDERERIAREMHDVLAHRISLLSVHAGALEFRTKSAADPGHRPMSPEEVHDAAVVIRENAHLAVEELRELLEVLREDESASPLGASRPQPRLEDVRDLIDEARRAGQHVDMTIDEAAVQNARASVQRTAYRIVQEGLTNARKHAPHSPVSVAIRGDDGRLRVEVTNPVALGLTATEIPGAGAGLAGLTERVRIDGGKLRHGLTGGIFALSGELPIGTP